MRLYSIIAVYPPPRARIRKVLSAYAYSTHTQPASERRASATHAIYHLSALAENSQAESDRRAKLARAFAHWILVLRIKNEVLSPRVLRPAQARRSFFVLCGGGGPHVPSEHRADKLAASGSLRSRDN